MIQRWLDECKMLDLRIGFLLWTATECHERTFTDEKLWFGHPDGMEESSWPGPIERSRLLVV